MQSFIAWFIPSFVHSLIHGFINSLIHSFIHSIHSKIHSNHSFTRSFIPAFIHAFIHSLLHYINMHACMHTGIPSLHSVACLLPCLPCGCTYINAYFHAYIAVHRATPRCAEWHHTAIHHTHTHTAQRLFLACVLVPHSVKKISETGPVHGLLPRSAAMLQAESNLRQALLGCSGQVRGRCPVRHSIKELGVSR